MLPPSLSAALRDAGVRPPSSRRRDASCGRSRTSSKLRRASASAPPPCGRGAARGGGPPAIIAPEGRLLWTFEDLVEAAARFAGGLRELGVETGDRGPILEREPRGLSRSG